jgi:hypothetical protein
MLRCALVVVVLGQAAGQACSSMPGVELKGEKYFAESNTSTAADCCSRCTGQGSACAAFNFKAADIAVGTSCKLLARKPTDQKMDSDFVAGIVGPSPTPAGPCKDVPPAPATYTCTQQKSWGKCDISQNPWMVGFCCKTCFDCAPGCGASGPTPPPAPTPAPPTPAPLDMYKGLCYASWATVGADSYDSTASDASIKMSTASGVNILAITQTYYQDNQNSTSIAASDAKTNTDAGLTRAIASARANGLRIALKPHVDFLNDDLHWRGEIGPSFSASDWVKWFDSYTVYMMHMAQFAAQEQVDLFVIGTELITTEPNEELWRSLISKIKSVTGKIPLVYAANWSPGPQNIKWWDVVDLIGVDVSF